MAYIDDLNTMTEVTFDKILGLASHYLPEVNKECSMDRTKPRDKGFAK